MAQPAPVRRRIAPTLVTPAGDGAGGGGGGGAGGELPRATAADDAWLRQPVRGPAAGVAPGRRMYVDILSAPVQSYTEVRRGAEREGEMHEEASSERAAAARRLARSRHRATPGVIAASAAAASRGPALSAIASAAPAASRARACAGKRAPPSCQQRRALGCSPLPPTPPTLRSC